MATHITCHSNECLPNRFPPPRPTQQCHGMLSDYEKGHVMNQSVPTITTSVEGGTAFPNDSEIEPLPMYRRIQPVAYNRHDSNSLFDSDLCLTPEKTSPRKKKAAKKSSIAGASLTQRDGLTETKTPKVRFDQMVTVKRISPPREADQSDIIEIDRSEDIGCELSFDDSTPFSDNSQYESSHEEDDIETLPKTYSYDMQDRLNDSDPLLSIITQTNSLDISSNSEICDTDRNFSKSALRRKIAKCSPVKESNLTDTMSTDIIDVKAQKMASAKTLLVESGEAEHVLARPEFNSTLFMSKEVEQATGEEINLSSAVAEKLKKSGKIRARVDERTYAVLNEEDPQFRALISVDVHEDDLVETVTKEIGSRAKPAHRMKQPKPEDSLPCAPNIMEFFTPDLQREVPNLSMSHIPPTTTRISLADPLSAFDTYTHIRAWEEW